MYLAPSEPNHIFQTVFNLDFSQPQAFSPYASEKIPDNKISKPFNMFDVCVLNSFARIRLSKQNIMAVLFSNECYVQP